MIKPTCVHMIDLCVFVKLMSTCVYMIDFFSCPESTRPDEKRSCILPCSVDCMVTAFSEWSPCPTSCSPSKYRHISAIRLMYNL